MQDLSWSGDVFCLTSTWTAASALAQRVQRALSHKPAQMHHFLQVEKLPHWQATFLELLPCCQERRLRLRSDKRIHLYFSFQAWLRRQKKALKRFEEEDTWFLLCAFWRQTGKYWKGGALVLYRCPPEYPAHVLRSSVARQRRAGLSFAGGLFWVTAFQSKSGRSIEDSALCQKQRPYIFFAGFVALHRCLWTLMLVLTCFMPPDLPERHHWCCIFSLWNLKVDPTIKLNLSESTKTRCDGTLESPATLAPERDRSSPSPCPTPPPSPPNTPPPSPPPIPALTPRLPLPAVRRVLEDGEGTSEESAHGTQASPDSFCRVMGLLGMGHRLFVPRLLAVRNGDWNWK